MKMTWNDYGYETPASMAFVAWAGNLEVYLEVRDSDAQYYTVTDWSGDGQLTILPVSGTGERTVNVDDILFASR